MSAAIPTSTEDRALALLGQGVGAEAVAAAIGVTPSAISQLLSRTDFAASVAELRFRNLSKHNERDSAYDRLEDELIDKMRDLMPFMVRPMEVAKVLQIINGAKRRGSSAPEHITQQQTVITLNMPTTVVQKFQVNTMNQVVQAGQQALITVQSASMEALLSSARSTNTSHAPTPAHPSLPGPPNVEHHLSNAGQNG